MLPSVDCPSNHSSRLARVISSIGSGLNADGGILARYILGGGTAVAMLGGSASVDGIGEEGKAKSETVSREGEKGARTSCISECEGGSGREGCLKVERVSEDNNYQNVQGVLREEERTIFSHVCHGG